MEAKSTIILAVCIAASVSSLGATTYSYDANDAKIYIATVPSGETNAITEAAADVLNGGGVTNFVKRGTGTLISNRDITSYTGGIRIEEGIFHSAPNTIANDTVGKLSGGGEIWVIDGATMELYAPGMYSTHMAGKAVHIAGRGQDDRGALVSCSGNKNQAGASFGNVTLEDDALVSNESAAYFHLAVNGSTFNFNSHTLYLGGTGDVGFDNKPTLQNMPGTTSNPSTAIVSEGYGVKFSGGTSSTMWNLWHAYCGISLTNSTRLIFDSYCGNSFAWPVIMHPGSGIHVKANTKAWGPTTSYNTITDNGVVHLLDSDRNWVQFNLADNFLQIKGKVTGGGLLVKTYTPGAALYLRNKSNDFTNGVVAVNCSINVMTNGALPASGAALSLTNGYAVFHSSQAYTLPPLKTHGNCAVTNYAGFSPSGAWRDSVLKTGAGTLEYNTLVGAPLLDVRGGSVKVNGSNGALPAFEAFGGVSAGTIDLGGESYSVGALQGSPTIANCPALTVTSRLIADASSDGTSGITTDGTLSFSNGAAISVQNPSVVVPGRKRRSWRLATAAGGIEGMPDCSALASGWSLVKSADGKSLTLYSPVVGFKMVVR